jgi:nicotinamidase-related amidase
MKQNSKDSALLVMDIQGATLRMLKDNTTVLDSISKAIKTARSKEIPVIYVVVGFRKGYPEVSANNKSFLRLKSGAVNFDAEDASQIPASIGPRPEDIVITKKRVSAFTGSDLEVVLRSLGITHILLTGIATSGVVLSTLREAADKDYKITVLSDCCADSDDEVHNILINKIFPRQAEVMTIGEWSSYN